jgi:hypothetical protein
LRRKEIKSAEELKGLTFVSADLPAPFDWLTAG